MTRPGWDGWPSRAPAPDRQVGPAPAYESFVGPDKTHSIAFPFNFKKSKQDRHPNPFHKHGWYALQGPGEGGRLLFGWKNDVSKSPARVAEALLSVTAVPWGALPADLGRGAAPVSPKALRVTVSPALSHPGGPAARGARACAGGRWASGVEGPQGRHHICAKTHQAGPSPGLPPILAAQPCIRVLPLGRSRPQLQNPSPRGGRAPEGPKPQHSRGAGSSQAPAPSTHALC